MSKQTKFVVVVDSIPERTTNKTKVPPNNTIMNKWVQNVLKINKRMLVSKRNNKWYQNKGLANKNLQQRRNVWGGKEVSSE